MTSSRTPEPTPLSIEAFLASEPNADARRATAEDRADILNITERKIVAQLLAEEVPGAFNLSTMMKAAPPDSGRQSEYAASRFHELEGSERHSTIRRVISRDISLAFAVGAIAEATTATGSDPATAAERFALAEGGILDSQLPDETRQALGTILIEGANLTFV